MDYKEKYETALGIAKMWHKNTSVPKDCKAIFERMFPELQESEDERIRKALIDYFDDANKSDVTLLQSYGIQTHKVIDWLEKQGEPIDKEKNSDRCKCCNNIKGCVTCVDGSEWAHIYE